MKYLILASLIACAAAIPIDNGVEGEPEIECGSNSISINFNTRNPFEGQVYVKGRNGEAGCRNENRGRQVAGISLGFDQCGTTRTRSLNPRGVFVTTTVVISFHPKFVTKIDRAYTVQCFYMEADKTVSAQLEVSMLTTAFQTQVVPMPVCRYEILDGGPTGQPIQYALVGQQVYHKWTCDSETTDVFCMTVHTCFVDNGAGDRVQILDDNGCAIDRFLLNNLEYPSDLMGGVEAHVFRYADQAQLFFQCQISISIKDPGQQCVRPQCAAPTGFAGGAAGGAVIPAGTSGPAAATPAGASPAAETTAAAPATTAAPASTAAPAAASPAAIFVLRKRRAAMDENSDVLDVSAGFNTLDIDDQLDALPKEANLRAPQPRRYGRIGGESEIDNNGICMSSLGFATFLFLAVALIAAVAVASSCLLLRK